MLNDAQAQLASLLQLNQHLLTLAQQEAWEAVSERIEAYTQGMYRLCARDFTHTEPSQRQAVAAQLACLLAQDAQLMQCLQQRVSSVRGEMATLRKSRASVRAYLAG